MYHMLLIAAQFALAAVLVLSADWSPIPWGILLLTIPGIAMAVWAWLTMGLLRLRVHPTTTDQTRLITNGPYAMVRHPMYAGLLWFTASLLISGFAWWRIGMWLALLAVLVAKTREEEAAMSEHFPEYVRYQSATRRFFPTRTSASKFD